MGNRILVAGATGNLGMRIVDMLCNKGAVVTALVRESSDPEVVRTFKDRGVTIYKTDLTDAEVLKQACIGIDCVVSALQGLRDVIVDGQQALLEAAVAAGVPRFIPSDYASDFTALEKGQNRNFDLRSEFHGVLYQAAIQPTSVLNGAFAEILGSGTPLLDLEQHTVGYWGDADWKMDFTSMDDVAAYVAEAAMDDETPAILRIAGFQVSAEEIAAAAEKVFGVPFALVRMGSVEELAAHNTEERKEHPEGENELYPRWQQGQYLQSMFSVRMEELDNERYADVRWTGLEEVIAGL
jgi:uncharacterized protein YbjT (DUF2867 family)